jgi:hypothetical protein
MFAGTVNGFGCARRKVPPRSSSLEEIGLDDKMTNILFS